MFSTDVAEVFDFMQSAFSDMVVSAGRVNAGELTFLRSEKGFVMRSANTHEFEGTTIDELLPLIKDEVRLQFMRGRPDLLWIHAGAVARDGGALLLAGASGEGKSTLSTMLCDRGWSLLSDDISPLRTSDPRVLPFLQTPVRRIGVGREISRDNLHTLDRELVRISPSNLARGEAEVRAVVFLRYVAGRSAEIELVAPGPGVIELLRNATNFYDHKAGAVAMAANLSARIPMYRVTYGNPIEAATAIDSLISDGRTS